MAHRDHKGSKRLGHGIRFCGRGGLHGDTKSVVFVASC